MSNDTLKKHPGGRPLLFKTVEELQTKVDAYFAWCDPHPEKITTYEYQTKKVKTKLRGGKTILNDVADYSKKPIAKTRWDVTAQKPYTITGLANFLNTSRVTLIHYQERDEFFNTIKGAKDKIEEYWEHELLGKYATGPIFNLKNNYPDWNDKTQSEITNPDHSLNPMNGLTTEELRKLAKKKGK